MSGRTRIGSPAIHSPTNHAPSASRADQEQEPDAPEHVQRLQRAGRDERGAQQVEEAVHESRRAELAACRSWRARCRTGTLADAEAAPVRERGQEAVQLAVDLERLGDLAAVELEARS